MMLNKIEEEIIEEIYHYEMDSLRAYGIEWMRLGGDSYKFKKALRLQLKKRRR